MDWLPYDRDLHHERVNAHFQIFNEIEVEYFHLFSIFEKFSFMPIKFTMYFMKHRIQGKYVKDICTVVRT